MLRQRAYMYNHNNLGHHKTVSNHQNDAYTIDMPCALVCDMCDITQREPQAQPATRENASSRKRPTRQKRFPCPCTAT